MSAPLSMETSEDFRVFLFWRSSFFESIKRFFENLNLSTVFTDEQLIISVLNHLCQNEVTTNIIEPPMIGRKSDEISRRFRENGDKYAKTTETGRFNLSVEAYTKSIAYGIPGSRDRAIAFASRAGVLYQAGVMEGCARDIDQALNDDYPSHLRAMLHLRQAILHGALNSPSKVYEAYQGARKWAKKTGTEMQKIVKKRISEQQGAKLVNNSQFWMWKHHPILPTIERNNPTFKGASNAIQLKYSEKFGKHFVATRDIRPGETLMALEPLVKVVPISMKYKCCWNCGEQTWSSSACDRCAQVIFCSPSCRDVAMKTFHKFECPLMELFAGEGMNETELIDLRLTILTACKGQEFDGSFQKFSEKMNSETDPLKVGSVKGVFDSSSPESIFSMKKYTDENMTISQKRRKMEKIMTNSILKAYFLATKTNFFGKKLTGNLSTLKDNKKFIDAINFLNECKLLSESNAFVVSSPCNTKTAVETFRTIVPGLGFFNHSCNPNITKNYQDGYLVVTATMPIRKGEQVFDNYSATFHGVPREERQAKLLEKFKFKCECEACERGWPMTLSQLEPSDIPEYERMSFLLFKTRTKIDSAMKNFDFSRPRERRDSLMDLSRDYDNIVELINYFWHHYEKNTVELFIAICSLKDYLCLKERPYMSLH